jgi:hypothetical protein
MPAEFNRLAPRPRHLDGALDRILGPPEPPLTTAGLEMAIPSAVLAQLKRDRRAWHTCCQRLHLPN